MSALAVEQHFTPEDLLAMPDGERFELVDGQLVEKEMGAESNWVANLVSVSITQFVRRHGLGWVFTSECGYQCFADEPHRVRKPDVSFVAHGRLPGNRIPTGHISVAPDLAVEVTSPNDQYGEVREKVEEYLAAGVRLVWVVDPRTRSIEVFRADGSVSLFHVSDEITGDEVIPGYRCAVSEFFSSVPAPAQSSRP